MKDWLLMRKAGERGPGGGGHGALSPLGQLGAHARGDARRGRRTGGASGAAAEPGAPAREVPVRKQGFMLATPATRAPEGADWLFEIKHDGVRVLAERAGDTVTLVGRSGQD